jgi:hypothetical protein
MPAFLFANGASVEVVAMIDTGASVTAVRPDLVERMRAIDLGYLPFTQVGMPPRRMPTYYFTIRLGSDSQEFAVEALAVAPASKCDVLIGRDLLSRWVLNWDGPADRLVISY